MSVRDALLSLKNNEDYQLGNRELRVYVLARPQFFKVWQNVLQTKPSKTTILPEGASDGLVNNFDQPKRRKTSF